MKVVLDTNVVISGIFFSGPPREILHSWSRGKIQLLLTPEIFEEYQRVAAELNQKYPSIEIRRMSKGMPRVSTGSIKKFGLLSTLLALWEAGN